MAYRREEFAVDEWYHCYTRSIDKRAVFETERDYERFLQALYISNAFDRIRWLAGYAHVPTDAALAVWWLKNKTNQDA